MSPFEIYYVNFELLPKTHQLYTTLTSTTEEVSETLETEDIDMT